MSTCIKYKELSNQANAILSSFTNENIIYLQEELSHDGYDSFGAKSNLWDLDIIIELNNDYIFYSFHWEDWYSKNQINEYELWQPTVKLSQANKENINYFKKKTNDIKFNETFEKRLKKIYP